MLSIMNLDDINITTKDGQLFQMENFEFSEEEPFPIDVSDALGPGVEVAGALQIFTSETDKDYDDRTDQHEFNNEAVPQG